VPLYKFVPRGFEFVHHSIAILYIEVPNPNITIRNFFIAVRGGVEQVRDGAGWTLLGRAARCGELATVTWLMSNGGDMLALQPGEQLPRQVADEAGHWQVLTNQTNTHTHTHHIHAVSWPRSRG
jgi:hypothetical protein